MKNLKITSHDFEIKKNNLYMIDNSENILQGIQMNLAEYLGAWICDKSIGFNWNYFYQDKRSSITQLKQQLSDFIEKDPNIKNVKTIEIDVKKDNIHADITCTTIYDEEVQIAI